MVISESGLCAAMKAAYKKKSTGYKVAVRLSEDGEEEIILSAPDWIAIINRENAPRKVLALIVEHVGDLPAEDKAFQVQDTKAQTEIYSMAVPKLGKPVENAAVKRTQLQYNGYQIWQRTDNHYAGSLQQTGNSGGKRNVLCRRCRKPAVLKAAAGNAERSYRTSPFGEAAMGIKKGGAPTDQS